MKTTLNIAGDVAGMKNLRSAFSMPMNAAATAISIRNGMLTRVELDRQLQLAGLVGEVSGVPAVSGPANTMPRTTRTPVTTSRPLMTCDPRRHAASLPSW